MDISSVGWVYIYIYIYTPSSNHLVDFPSKPPFKIDFPHVFSMLFPAITSVACSWISQRVTFDTPPGGLGQVSAPSFEASPWKKMINRSGETMAKCQDMIFDH